MKRSMNTIRNPIIPGFFPDPSIVRVGEDYYIANSTFEWLPGVPIHHSKDLRNWRLIGHGLKKRTLPDLRGVPNSGGVWAPSLSHADGKFWLVYSVVKTWGPGQPFKDLPNYLITAERITGPWSEPVFLHARGFDASLFHDDDGRKWIVGMEWDHRKGRPRFGGIVLQEYDPARRSMVGPVHNILKKDMLIEGPNLYKRNGWYYLMLAEGGTGWNHGISMARSRKIEGPYELDPEPSVVTSRDDESLELQKAGHGELVETPAGEWYLVHLCSRPLRVGADRRCILGRETAIQKVRWTEDGWLRLAAGGAHPQVDVPAPAGIAPRRAAKPRARDDFDGTKLDVQWSALRVHPDESWASLKARPGWLRLRGRDSQHSLHDQSLLVRRMTSTHCTAETCMEFTATDYKQSAGLIFIYDCKLHYYLRVSNDEACGSVLGIVLTDDGKYDELRDSEIAVGDWPRFYLRAEIDGARLQFTASPDGQAWQNIGPVLDASKISDDYNNGLRFTGAMVGLCAQDLGQARATADFDWFDVKNSSSS